MQGLLTDDAGFSIAAIFLEHRIQFAAFHLAICPSDPAAQPIFDETNDIV